MINLIMKSKDGVKEVKLKEEILFNFVLIKHQDKIKKLIKSIKRDYKFSDAFFTIINKYVEFDENGVSIYPGLVIRTNLDDYAILYLENTTFDLDYAKKLIEEFSQDQGDHIAKEINISEFEINSKDFLNIQK